MLHFRKLRGLLDDSYAIVLVGLTEKQRNQLPQGILGILRTNSPRELAEIYTAADVFVNPSREESFGMTTIEAKACGTEAIVYKNTACEEIVSKMGGIAVEQDVAALCDAIRSLTAHE
jgi:glycosyltransferase involved in cell wall biosynthesis